MLLVDPVLALVGLLVFPALFLANMVFQRAMSPRVTRAQQLRAEVSEVAHESFEAALVVKTMGREEQETERFAEVTRRLREANIEVGRTARRLRPGHRGDADIGTLAVLPSARRGRGRRARPPTSSRSPTSSRCWPSRSGRSAGCSASCPRTVVGWDRVDAVLGPR